MSKARQISQIISGDFSESRSRIAVFTGARQVGKTTLVRNLLKDYAYLSIEDPVMRATYSLLSAQQWHLLYPKAALDEVQKEPRLIESIKSTYDQYSDVRYVLLGSSQLLLLSKVRESLAGRCIIYDLYPLVLPELRTNDFNQQVEPSLWQKTLLKESFDILPHFSLDPEFAEKSAALRHYLDFGGYPALVDATLNDDARYLWLSNYVRTYLERDIRDLASMRDLEPFIKLQKTLALETGSLFNASSIAVRTGISLKTVQRYLGYLELSYQALRLPSWERNQAKRLVKTPKVHFMDIGVLRAVLGRRGGLSGREFESAIIAELFKQAKNIRSDASFYHLRTHDGFEIDALVETEEGYYAFEIKLADHIQKTDARHLLAMEPILDKPLLHGYLLSNDPQTTELSPKVTAISVGYFLG